MRNKYKFASDTKGMARNATQCIEHNTNDAPAVSSIAHLQLIYEQFVPHCLKMNISRQQNVQNRNVLDRPVLRCGPKSISIVDASSIDL
eukprot:898263-Rhodomonas_salina.2